MEHVNAFFPYFLAVELADLKVHLEKKRLTRGQLASRAWFAVNKVREFDAGEFIPLNGESESGIQGAIAGLLDALNEARASGRSEPRDLPAKYEDKRGIVDAITSLETRFELDAARISLYFVPQRLAYNTQTMLDRAEAAFIENAILPDEAKADIREAGRCIAFQLSTAAAFHVLRGAEAVIRMYLWMLGGPIPEKTEWAAYIDAIGHTRNAPPHVVGRLHRLRDLERNQLMHVTLRPLLSPTEGLEVFEYVKDAINAMCIHMARLCEHVRRTGRPPF